MQMGNKQQAESEYKEALRLKAGFKDAQLNLDELQKNKMWLHFWGYGLLERKGISFNNSAWLESERDWSRRAKSALPCTLYKLERIV